MYARIFLCFWILLSAAPGWAAARVDASVHALALDGYMSLLEDPEGKLSLAEIQARTADFKPRTGRGEINLGYSKSFWWLRVEIDPASDIGPGWWLQIGYPPLDAVDVWLPAGKDWKHYHTGDHLPFASHPTPHRNYVFPLDLTPGQPAVVYLRVATSGTMTVPVTVFSDAGYMADTERSYLLHALYFGMLFALGGYNLLLFFSIRDRAYLLYVLFVVGLGVGQACQSGLAAQYVVPDLPLLANLGYPIGFAMAGLFGACFTRAFLDTARRLPRLNSLLKVLGNCFIGGAILSLFNYPLGAQFLSAIGVIFSLLAVWVGLVSLRDGNPSARLFLLAWIFLLVGACIMGLRTLNLIPTNSATLYGLQIGSAIEMLLLSFALADRINHMRREKIDAQAKMLASERKLREMLQDNEKRLEARVAERTHELEEANQQLTENEERFRYMAQHDALTGLANRVLLYDRLEHLLHRSRRNGSAFAILMLDLDGFKQVNDTHGHAAGDTLLTQIANRLQNRMRASDTVARIGGDEFAILLEPTAGADEAQHVGDNLLAELKQSITLDDGITVTVGGSIGVALWPRDGDDAESLLRAADRAMYRAKENGNTLYSGEEAPDAV